MRWISLLTLMLARGFGQPATAPAFEVASVRPHVFPKGTFGFGSASIVIKGNKVTAAQASIQGLMIYAYGVKEYQILGVVAREPPWSDFFDIAATTTGDAAAPEDQVRQMVQALLADRFQLKLHRETRELPVYNLIVGKNGLKTKPSAADTTPGIKTKVEVGGVVRMEFSNQPLSALLRILNGQSSMDRPALDKTGLKGGYDFTLEFSPTVRGGDSGGADPVGSSMFTAVQEQLGLKLDPAREPTEVLVIDHVEGPSAN
ncbi:MAG TPA: TIGR03435 family protein [Bryobacteraceae bacterium]